MLKQGAKIRKRNELPYSSCIIFFIPPYVTDLPIYSYKNKLGGWNVVKDKYIQLPIKDNKPDYELMATLISAIKKPILKKVASYVEGKRETTKAV